MRSVWLVVALALALELGASATVSAQNCTRGIPCGNTCIARNRTCRVGQGTARAAQPRTQPAPAATQPVPSVPASSFAPAANVAPSVPTAIAPAALAPAPSSTTHPYSALRSGTFYYKRSCRAAQELPRSELVYFRTEQEALDAGRVRSAVAGC